MRRLAVISASVVTLLAATGVSAAQAVQDAGTAQVCDVSGQRVEAGLDTFTVELHKAGAAASQGDLAGAETYVRHSGTLLIELGGQLRKDAEPARDAQLRSAIEDFAKELEALGGALTGVSSLERFDTTRLVALAERVSEICGEV